jgi:spore germination protein KB
MEKKYCFSPAQLVMLIICTRMMFPYTFMPVVNIPPRNQDAWIIAIISAAYTFLFSVPVFYLINRFRDAEYGEILETILGKAAGKAFLILFSLFFFYCSSACLVIGDVFISTYLFPETPSWYLLLFAVGPALYLSLKGAGSIVRVAFFAVPYILLTIILFLLLSLDQLDISILRPMFADSGFWSLNWGGILTTGYYSEVLIFLVLFPSLKPKASINKALTSSVLLYTAALLVMVIPTLTLLGLDISRHSWNPYFVFTRQVKAFSFIQRVESLNVIAWFMGFLVKIALYNFMACYTLSKVFGTKTHKVFTGPLFLLSYIAALLPFLNRTNVIDMLRSHKVFAPIIFFYILILPTAAIVVYWLRRKKVDARLRPGGGETQSGAAQGP